MTVLSPADLSSLQRTYLGVLALGLVSADQARDPRFRIEYICARCQAMVERRPADDFADAAEHRATEPFRAELREAIIDLDRKGVIGLGPPQDLVVLRPSPESREAAYARLDLNYHPPIFDRYLAQRCMDELLSLPEAHTYLMALYADSGDVWHEIYQRGESQWR
ncbi:MAG TPA: hypothetical protein VFD32_07425 [Dehalococcoidia bacterium]|nr:hypothetical protein [Dehalococcoidia bacterium]